jgi:hypothetical protein
MEDQLAYISLAVPKRWHLDWVYVQPIVKIAPKFVTLNQLGEIAMGGRHEPDVDAMRAAASESLKLLFLQHTQEFRLEGKRQITNFIEEESAGVRHFEASYFLRNGSGECALLVPEQFAL